MRQKSYREFGADLLSGEGLVGWWGADSAAQNHIRSGERTQRAIMRDRRRDTIGWPASDLTRNDVTYPLIPCDGLHVCEYAARSAAWSFRILFFLFVVVK
jgi:hypothetical protein